MSVTVLLKLKEIPKTCASCPFYSEPAYTCHNERGNEAHCALGYMHGDMRDVSFRRGKLEGTRYSGCQLENNKIEPNESIH